MCYQCFIGTWCQQNTELHVLICHQNQINSIDVSKNVALTQLFKEEGIEDIQAYKIITFQWQVSLEGLGAKRITKAEVN